MKPEVWGIIIAVTSVVGLIAYIVNLLKDNVRKNSMINRFEHEADKEKLREESKAVDFDTVIERVRKRITRGK